MSEEIPIYPMDEALSHWQQRVPVSPDDFYALDDALRARAFTVSKLTRMDMIQRTYTEIENALQSGESMAAFRTRMQDFFLSQGYDGPVSARYRLHTIFRSAIMQSIGAGRWEQAQDGINDRPYGLYDAIEDGRTRPDHLAQNGKVYLLTHAYWRTWWPPNGFGCRCSVRTLSAAEVNDLGYTIHGEIPGAAPQWPTNPGLNPAAVVQADWQRYSPELVASFLDSARKVLSPDEVIEIENDIARAA